jgi:EmrB/QacA subfamily drug resistance transporter
MVNYSKIADADATQAAERTPPGGAILLVLCAAAFMASLDVFIVNVAFTAIGRDLHSPSLSDLSWILNGYTIIYAALLVPVGRLADRYGRKAGFLGGLALFTAASAACALSPSLWWLVAFRVLQAAGAAMLTPTSLGLLLTATAPQRRARAVRIWAAAGAVAAALGPAIGGLLVAAAWQWVFLVNVPVGVLALIAALRWVPDSRDEAVTGIPDLLGATLLAIAVGALALALVQGPQWGWSTGPTLAGFVVAAVGAVLFVARTWRHPRPIVEPALLRVRAFVWANVTALLFSVAFAAALLCVILWLQNVDHYSALRTGLAVAPGPLMVPPFAIVSQRLSRRVPVGVLVALGCLLFGLGSVLLIARVDLHTQYASQVLPGWLVGGAGVGLALPNILSAATADLPPARAATGSAVVNMARQIGMVLGVSVLVAILGATTAADRALRVFGHGWWAIAAVSAVAAGTALGMTPARSRT